MKPSKQFSYQDTAILVIAAGRMAGKMDDGREGGPKELNVQGTRINYDKSVI